MKNKKLSVEVRDHGKFVKFIERVCRAENFGNFSPIFCTYRGKRYLVHSDAGDLSDPFRRDAKYLESLFIKLEQQEKKDEQAGD